MWFDLRGCDCPEEEGIELSCPETPQGQHGSLLLGFLPRLGLGDSPGLPGSSLPGTM